MAGCGSPRRRVGGPGFRPREPSAAHRSCSIFAPIAWTTLELTVHADGRSEQRLAGASPFPRHWIYESDGSLAAKSGLIDYKDWAGTAFGTHTPWGDEDSPTLVTEVETALERQLSDVIMHDDAKPQIRKLKAGDTLTEQGATDSELFLLLDGVLVVEVDGTELAEVGPGAVVGERALARGRCANVDAAGTHGESHRRSAVRDGRPRSFACPRRRPPARGSARADLRGRGGS